jgi:hypothetical protein
VTDEACGDDYEKEEKEQLMELNITNTLYFSSQK